MGTKLSPANLCKSSFSSMPPLVWCCYGLFATSPPHLLRCAQNISAASRPCILSIQGMCDKRILRNPPIGAVKIFVSCHVRRGIPHAVGQISKLRFLRDTKSDEYNRCVKRGLSARPFESCLVENHRNCLCREIQWSKPIQGCGISSSFKPFQAHRITTRHHAKQIVTIGASLL